MVEWSIFDKPVIMEPPISRLHEKLKHLTPQQRAQALSILRKLIPIVNAEATAKAQYRHQPELLDAPPDPSAPGFLGTYDPPPAYTVEPVPISPAVVSGTTPGNRDRLTRDVGNS
jgi:hypothetical protein